MVTHHVIWSSILYTEEYFTNHNFLCRSPTDSKKDPKSFNRIFLIGGGITPKVVVLAVQNRVTERRRVRQLSDRAEACRLILYTRYPFEENYTNVRLLKKKRALIDSRRPRIEPRGTNSTR